MQQIQALSPLQLCWRCDPAQFDFETTEQLDDLSEFVGQTRAGRSPLRDHDPS